MQFNPTFLPLTFELFITYIHDSILLKVVFNCSDF